MVAASALAFGVIRRVRRAVATRSAPAVPRLTITSGHQVVDGEP